ncbi:MAG: regulatory protein RecX [Sphaerochaetaceae bacterium]
MVFATIERGAKGEGYFAVPTEGSSFFISKEQFVQFNLHVKQELTSEEFFALQEKLLATRCRLKALDYLARREHNRRELALKLLQKDFPKEIIELQLNRLEEEHLLSDLRYVQQFIASRQRKNPEGSKLLLMRLQQRGANRQIAQEEVDRWFSEPNNWREALEKASERAFKKTGDNREGLIQELQKRGFAYHEITTFLNEKGED